MVMSNVVEEGNGATPLLFRLSIHEPRQPQLVVHEMPLHKLNIKHTSPLHGDTVS